MLNTISKFIGRNEAIGVGTVGLALTAATVVSGGFPGALGLLAWAGVSQLVSFGTYSAAKGLFIGYEIAAKPNNTRTDIAEEYNDNRDSDFDPNDPEVLEAEAEQLRLDEEFTSNLEDVYGTSDLVQEHADDRNECRADAVDVVEQTMPRRLFGFDVPCTRRTVHAPAIDPTTMNVYEKAGYALRGNVREDREDYSDLSRKGFSKKK